MPVEYYLLLSGVVLLLVELAVPGFGVFGVAGMLCLTAGGYYVMGGGAVALGVMLTFYLLLCLLIVLLCVYLPKESKWNPFVLWDKQRNLDGYTGGRDFSELLGSEGMTLTPLRPAGTMLAGGRRMDVCSLGDYIDKGVVVRVVKVEGSKVFVEKLSDNFKE